MRATIIKPGDVVVMPFAFSDGTCLLPRGSAHRLRARRVLRQQRHERRTG
jgi:hypothetical protein